MDKKTEKRLNQGLEIAWELGDFKRFKDFFYKDLIVIIEQAKMKEIIRLLKEADK